MIVRIIFDGPPGPESGRFIEVENESGESVSLGDWRPIEGSDWWELRFEIAPGGRMSERDEIALKCLAAMLTGGRYWADEARAAKAAPEDAFAEWAYGFADVFLERSRPSPPREEVRPGET